MPKLNDEWFEAKFYGEISADGKSMRYLDSIDGAQGLFLWCPCGYGKPEFPLNAGRPHGVLIPFVNPRNAPPVPADHGPVNKTDGKTRPRWTMSGTGLHDLTITPSVDVGKDSCWHGFITNGEIK